MQEKVGIRSKVSESLNFGGKSCVKHKHNASSGQGNDCLQLGTKVFLQTRRNFYVASKRLQGLEHFKVINNSLHMKYCLQATLFCCHLHKLEKVPTNISTAEPCLTSVVAMSEITTTMRRNEDE